MKRRYFLGLSVAMVASSVVVARMIDNVGDEPGAGNEFIKSDEEWRRSLTQEQFHVLRREGTERPFSSVLNSEKRAGVYSCAGCGLALFTSEMKYDSGTGWPSFFTTIVGSLDTKLDFIGFFPRHEYHCRRCGGHQGHVFKDGPQPSGQRWCNNGLALNFKAA